MKSLILRTTTKFLLALMLLFSLFILFRGHNEPGGGFIAGLITASAYALYVMAHGPFKARKLILLDFRYLLAIGISCVIISGLFAVTKHQSFLTGIWGTITIGAFNISLGTPLLFDIGVYIIVVSAIAMITIALEEK